MALLPPDSVLTVDVLRSAIDEIGKINRSFSLPDFRVHPTRETWQAPAVPALIHAFTEPFDIVVDAGLPDLVEDWSGVRSPSRARRRRAQGHRQNIKLVSRDDLYVVGNRGIVTVRQYEAIKRRMLEEINKQVREAFVGRK